MVGADGDVVIVTDQVTGQELTRYPVDLKPESDVLDPSILIGDGGRGRNVMTTQDSFGAVDVELQLAITASTSVRSVGLPFSAWMSSASSSPPNANSRCQRPRCTRLASNPRERHRLARLAVSTAREAAQPSFPQLCRSRPSARP